MFLMVFSWVLYVFLLNTRSFLEKKQRGPPSFQHPGVPGRAIRRCRAWAAGGAAGAHGKSRLRAMARERPKVSRSLLKKFFFG